MISKPMKASVRGHELIQDLADRWYPLSMKDAIEVAARVALNAPREDVNAAIRVMGSPLVPERKWHPRYG